MIPKQRDARTPGFEAGLVAQLTTRKGPQDKAQSSVASAGVVRMIDDLEAVIIEETSLLKARSAIDLRDFNDRKSKGLLDLRKALDTFENQTVDERVRVRLAGLQDNLQRNLAMLKLHMEAVRQIAEILSNTALEAESDGTYSRVMKKVLPAS